MLQTLTVAAVLGAAGPVPIPPAAFAPAPQEAAVVTAAYHLRNAAAVEVAEAVGRVVGPDRVVGVRAAENQFVVRGSAATHARVVQLVGEIDRTVPQVVVSALVAQVPVGFLADCGLTAPEAGGGCYSLTPRELALFQTALRHYPGRTVLSRPQLQMCDNQTAYVRIGLDVPVGTGHLRFVGVSLRVTPRIMPEGKILLRVEPQMSTPAAPVTVGTTGTAFPINIQTVQTTVLARDGETVVLAHATTGSDGKPAAMLFLLTPNVVRTEAGP